MSEMVMTDRLDCTDPARIRTTYDQCQAWSALTLDYCLVIVFTHTDRLHFCNCFVLAVCMFLYCRVSVLFVPISSFAWVWRIGPWGTGPPRRWARSMRFLLLLLCLWLQTAPICCTPSRSRRSGGRARTARRAAPGSCRCSR